MKDRSSDPRLGMPRCLAQAMTRPALVLIALLAIGAAPARAQDAGTAPARSDSVTVAPGLRHAIEYARWVRASGPWGRARLRAPRVAGAALGFEAVRPEAGTATADVPSPLPFARIDSLQVPVGSSRNGAIVGGVLGAVLGAAVASAAASITIFGPAKGPSASDIIVGVLGGGVPGACLGAVLGTAFTRWKTIYPEPRRSPERTWDSRSRGERREP